jgi:hypothetical protein
MASGRYGSDRTEAPVLRPEGHFRGKKQNSKAAEGAFVRGFGSDFKRLAWSDPGLRPASRPLQEARRVNVDFPAWMAESLDREARRLGVTRQSVIKIWIAERLEQRGG